MYLAVHNPKFKIILAVPKFAVGKSFSLALVVELNALGKHKSILWHEDKKPADKMLGRIYFLLCTTEIKFQLKTDSSIN